MALIMPSPDQPTDSTIVMIGFLLAFATFLGLVVLSTKAAKQRKKPPAVFDPKNIVVFEPSKHEKEESQEPAEKSVTDYQAIIDKEAQIRAEQDAEFQAQQEELKQSLAHLQAELKTTKTELAATQQELADKHAKFDKIIQDSRAALEEIKTSKPASSTITKPVPKHDFELGDTSYCLIEYTGSDGKTSLRNIVPRELKVNKNGDWLISAVDVDASRVKSFRIDRISSLAHNGQAFLTYDDILGVLRAIEISI